MRARSFFYVSLGILALALAYHPGATSATAQTPYNPIAAVEDGGIVFAANGNVYLRTGGGPYTYTLYGNVFTGGGPTPAQPTTFGAIKAQFRR
jgi:hypothetical protein